MLDVAVLGAPPERLSTRPHLLDVGKKGRHWLYLERDMREKRRQECCFSSPRQEKSAYRVCPNLLAKVSNANHPLPWTAAEVR